MRPVKPDCFVFDAGYREIEKSRKERLKWRQDANKEKDRMSRIIYGQRDSKPLELISVANGMQTVEARLQRIALSKEAQEKGVQFVSMQLVYKERKGNNVWEWHATPVIVQVDGSQIYFCGTIIDRNVDIAITHMLISVESLIRSKAL